MAAFRGVNLHTFLCFIFHLLFLNCINILAVTVSDTKCDEPWYISVDKKLTVSWTGDERASTVIANLTTKDTYGRKCDSNVTLEAEFRDRMFAVDNPCSNALYFLTVTLICGDNAKRQNLTVRTPPDAPMNVEMKATNVSIEVKWTSPPGKIQRYKVIVRGGRKNKEHQEKLTVSTSHTFTHLEPYTRYNVTVSAKNEDHWGQMSSVKTIRTLEGVPFSPENLRATDITTKKIALKWDDPEPETEPISEYYISWVENGTTDTFTRISNTTSFVIEKLFPYTMYHIDVAAANSVGNSTPTNLTEVTKLAVPDPPEIKIIAVTNTSISVEWKLSIFYRGPDPSYSLRWKLQEVEDAYNSTDVLEPSKKNLFTIQKLKPFSTYEVQVRAFNDAGFGLWSKILEATTLTGVPSKPRNLELSTKSSTNILITWNSPDPGNGLIERYKIAWKTKPKALKTEYTNATRFNARDLTPFTDYEFKVCAETEAGWGDWTAVLRVKTDIDVPSQPLNLTESGVTNSSIGLMWLAPKHKNAPHLSYVVRWMKIEDDTEEYDYYDDKRNATLDTDSWNKEEVNITSYEILNLASYTNYTVQVCGRSSAGQGIYTSPLLLQTAAGIPNSPAEVKATKVRPTSLTFRWLSPTYTNGPLGGYVIHWGVRGTAGSFVNTNLTTYECLGLRPYTEYFFSVAAETQGGQGPFASLYDRTTISTPSAPRNVFASATDHCIQLQWSIPEHPNAPSVHYSVKWRHQSDESSIQEYETNSTAYRIRFLSPETNYSIQVRALTRAGEGPWTEVIYVLTLRKDNSSAVIAGSVVGNLVLFFIIVCVVLLLLAKRKGGLKHIIQKKSTAKSSETLQTTISMPLEIINDSEKITVQNFDEHVLKLMAHGYYRLAQEFEKLGKESPTMSTNEAKKNENLTKNRWVKILPFDQSRVKLRPVGDEVEPDFINASYVPGDSYMLEYIATQGPLNNTVNDFWKMVWQESVFLMVMLTQCVERAKRTCEKYWPAAGTTVKYGNLEVHSVSESITPAYIQRIFLLTQDGKQRHVVHLHYMNWPVSGCPKSPDDFLSFVRTVRGQVSCGVTGPMLVHCSAGIGRTGTFIAVDRLSQQLSRQCEDIDVFGTVLEMRRYRSNLVQTEDQYYFIYLCVQRIIQEKRQEIEDDYGGGIYSN